MATEKTNYDNDGFIFDKDVFNLKLHESTTSEMCWGTRCVVTRVPGGWIYQYKETHGNNYQGRTDYFPSPVFVPWSEGAANPAQLTTPIG